MTKTDVEHVPSKDVQVLAPGGAMEALYDYMRGLPAEDVEDVQERIVRQILSATSIDEVSRAGSSVPSEQVLDVPIIVDEIRPDESSFTDGMDVYLHIVGRLSNGDPITVSTGSQDVIVKLVRLHQLGLLPVRLIMWRSQRPTKRGYYPTFARIEHADDF